MRQLLLAAGACAAVGFAGRADAQGPAMPGQVVGTGYGVNPVGQQLPRAAPPAGQPVNLPQDNPLLRRYDPNRPYDVFKGTDIDPSRVVAPVAGSGDQTVLDRLYDKMKSAFGYHKVPAVGRPAYVPGLSRRNREREDARQWWRD